MRYTFPEITHIDDVLEAIEGRDEFIVAEREGFKIVNYLVNFEDTFPTPDTKDSALNRLYTLRRECRGLKFYDDGTVAARPYHKFFNVNERPEMATGKLDLTFGFIILDKLDGSMVHPLLLNDEIKWSTKMGITDVADLASLYIGGGSINYNGFATDMIAAGKTPIFEWCSRSCRIVVDYPEDQLILTAIRDNKTGEYFLHKNMVQVATPYKIQVVQAWLGAFDSLTAFLAATTDLEDSEGYVIRFDSGHMAKAKNEWYCNLHKTKELLEFEKDVIGLILRNDQDDAKAFMDDEAKAKIDKFAEDLFKAMHVEAERLEWIVIAAKDNLNGSKKRFAMEEIPNYSVLDKGLLFRIWDDNDPLEEVKKVVVDNLGSRTKVEHIRPLIGGLKWERY